VVYGVYLLYVTFSKLTLPFIARHFYSQEHRNKVKAQLPVGSHSSVVVSITFLSNCNYIHLTYYITLYSCRVRS